MASLAKVSSLRLWQIMKFRLIFWIGFMLVIQFLISFQKVSDPGFNMYSNFFNATSFDQNNRPLLPVLWMSYLLIPCLIMLNSLKQLNLDLLFQTRGLQYTQRSVGILNCCFSYVIATIYWLITFFTIGAINLTMPDLSFGLTLLLGLYFILALYNLISLFDQRIAMMLVTAIIIISPYTTWIFNPLNHTMLLRSNAAMPYLPISLIILVTTTLMYIQIYPKITAK